MKESTPLSPHLTRCCPEPVSWGSAGEAPRNLLSGGQAIFRIGGSPSQHRHVPLWIGDFSQTQHSSIHSWGHYHSGKGCLLFLAQEEMGIVYTFAFDQLLSKPWSLRKGRNLACTIIPLSTLQIGEKSAVNFSSVNKNTSPLASCCPSSQPTHTLLTAWLCDFSDLS